MDSYSILNAVMLFFLMNALGMSISYREFVDRLRKPTGVLVAQTGQFLFLPLIGWAMTVAFQLDPVFASGVIAITTSPGGALSNIVALVSLFFSKRRIALWLD